MSSDEQRAVLAHGLKTPIAVIVGYAELLASRDDEETRREAAEQILTAARRLSREIDDLLDLDVSASSAPYAGAHGAGDGNGRRARSRVVLVDDDSSLRKLLRLTLPPASFEIAEASDGNVALELVEAQSPQLVLLDWNMPNVSGADVLKTLKARHSTLPVIVLTVAADQRTCAEALGADAFLTKPFSPLELLETVTALVADRGSGTVG